MNGAHDESACAVQKVAFLPVHLGGHVDTAVQVGDDDTLMSQGERPSGPAVFLHVEDAGFAAVLEI